MPTTSSGVFIVNFQHISHLFLVFLLLTLNKQMLAGLSNIFDAVLLPKQLICRSRPLFSQKSIIKKMFSKVLNTSLTQAFEDFQKPNPSKISITEALNRFTENCVSILVPL